MATDTTLHFRRVVDLAHILDESTPPFPGDPAISVERLADIPSSGYALSAWDSVFHTGTHLDAPSHFISEGPGIQDLAPDGIYTTCLVDVRNQRLIQPTHIPDELPTGTDILLFRTGWSERFGTVDYFHDHPVLSEAMAHWIVDQGYRMVGFDLPSPDHYPYTVHRILLGQGLYLLENLNRLELLPPNKVFHMICVPLPIHAEACWVRPLALLP